MYTIIGGGIGGLATALAFEKEGIPYQVYERAAEINEVGAGIWLAPNALQVIDYLGLLNEIQEQSNPINRITIAAADRSPITDSVQDKFKDYFGYSSMAIHRATLQQILFNKVPKNKVFLGKAFAAYGTIPQGQIEVAFEDGSSVETDFLIGADGINSKVRGLLFPESQIRYTGQTCWRGISNYQLAEDYIDRGIELWGDQIRFGCSQISDGKVYWFAVALSAPKQSDQKGKTKAKLLRAYKDFHPMVWALIRATPDDKIIRNDINDLAPLPQWHQQNICLMGDAAHATTPNMGQGGAQAIEDAFYLSQLIKKEEGAIAFEKFYQKRKSKVNAIVQQSRLTGQMAHLKYGQSLRNILMRCMPNTLLEKKLMEVYKLEPV